MTIPLLDFQALWRGSKCPRQLKAWLDHAIHYNPKLCSIEDLRTAISDSSQFYNPSSPAAIRDHNSERLDALFNRHQELLVAQSASLLFPDARIIESDSIWEHQGETLREIGWIRAMDTAPTKPVQLHKDNWHTVLPRLSAIRNPGLLHHMILARSDFLIRDSADSWLLLLVRPGVRVKDSYIAEAELTKWVFTHQDIHISQVLLLCPSEDYRAKTDQNNNVITPDPKSFFQLHSLNHSIKHMREPVSNCIPRILTRAAADTPCDSPRSCPACAPRLPPLPHHHIYTLHRGGKAVDLLEAQGITDLHDLSQASTAAQAEHKDRHYIQLKTIKTNLQHIDRTQLQTFLSQIRFPIAFLDFESTCEAFPPIEGAKPWEHIPFMYSLHCAENQDALYHPSAITADIHVMDPTQNRQSQLRQFATRLIDAAEGSGSIVAYGIALESATLNRLAQALPDLAPRLKSMRDRLIDLQTPFQQFWYYHPEQLGKLSLKKILPLMSSHNHATLDLQNGGEANLNYYFLTKPDALPEDIRQNWAAATIPHWIQQLSDYCSLDTIGLVHILGRLFELAKT